jgi:hypothetical protein
MVLLKGDRRVVPRHHHQQRRCHRRCLLQRPQRQATKDAGTISGMIVL